MPKYHNTSPTPDLMISYDVHASTKQDDLSSILA